MGLLDDVFRPLRLGDVARAMNDPGELAKTLKRAADTARRTALFVSGQNVADALNGAADRLDGIAGKIDSGLSVHANLKAVVGIYEAWSDIDPATIVRNPQRAAKAFGRLFKHVAVLAAYLPPPLNVYADFLSGFEDFFSDMQKATDLQSPYTPKGRALRAVMNQIDAGG
jgi:hypothetical protein